MPLPKAPRTPADILEDYGAPAAPESERKSTVKIVNAMEAKPAPKLAAASQTEGAAAKKRTTKTKVEAQSPAAPAKTPKKTATKTAAAKPAAPKAPSMPEMPETPVVEAAKVDAAAPKTAEKPTKKTTVKAAKTPAKAPAKPVARSRKTSAKTADQADSMPEVVQAAEAAAVSEAAAAAPVHAPEAALDHASDRRRAGNANRRGRAQTPDNLPKLFVLDTNVLMHDPLSLFRFAEHDVFLPMTVLEELDTHKKGLTDVARNARAVSRSLDQLIEANDGRIQEGVSLSLLGNVEASGRLWFETKPMAEALPAELPSFRGDNSILATVRGVAKAFPDRAVVLVSKDINMRIKATTLGIPAEDYFSDKVLDDTDMLYSGKVELPSTFWSSVERTLKSWQDQNSTFYSFEAEHPEAFIINACVTVAGDASFMAMVTAREGAKVTMRLMRDYRTKSHAKVWGIQARNNEQNMALNLLMDPDIDFVTILGQAGTGKTLMTLAAALAQTIDERRFSEIIMTRATVSVGEDIGFLPGTEEEKMAPWMGALEDNLEVLHGSSTGGDWGRQATMDLIKARIRVKSMSFMRGRTFLQKFVIIDEAQNLSPKQMKTLITRAGPGTKIVCLGNLAQIDTPYLTEGSSGLTYVVERFQGWPHAATLTLTRGERSRLAEFAADAL